jgi:hypothetical protein
MPGLAQDQIAVRASGARNAERPGVTQLPARTGFDEVAARRSLREQIAKLERELSDAFSAAYPRRGIDWTVGSPGGPRLLGVGELEELRDLLAMRLEDARRELRERTRAERGNVELIERMLVEPERHKWVRVSNQDVGEPGCKHWHSRPRLGLIGMLLGWWRVRISSGCPLARGRGLAPATPKAPRPGRPPSGR